MKIGIAGLDYPEGKVKFEDVIVDQLTEKCKPKKVSPYYVELMPDEFVQVDAIAVNADNLLDLLILDMDKCQTRIDRSEDEAEKTLMQKCIDKLETEIPLCDMEFSEEEMVHIDAVLPASFKPVVVVSGEEGMNAVIQQVFIKAGLIFFYTAGPEEVHAWDVKKGSDMVTCAGKIHSDLARGFIKGDVVAFDDFMQCHSFNDAKKQGLVKVVDRDHELEGGEIIEIRFNV
ncbi:MAG: DUF933 domain-containing protein [Bacteroidetes bacterium]|nr:DUF933 domain-containing protein [Bacteroidota bacterium]